MLCVVVCVCVCCGVCVCVCVCCVVLCIGFTSRVGISFEITILILKAGVVLGSVSVCLCVCLCVSVLGSVCLCVSVLGSVWVCVKKEGGGVQRRKVTQKGRRTDTRDPRTRHIGNLNAPVL